MVLGFIVLLFSESKWNIFRAVGSDVTKGEILIHAGKKITAAEIGIMSICGIKSVLVFQKPYIAVMSTGDEVINLFA